MRLRQSQMKNWMSCPLKAKFQDIERRATKQGSKAAFGTSMHAALEHYNRTTDLDMAIKVFLDMWDNFPIDVWNKYTTFGGLRQRGLEILRAYEDRMRWEERTVLAAEHRFLVPFGAHELEGTVDLASIRKNHQGKQVMAIEDYKVNSQKPSVAELRLNIQFTTYIYATHQKEFWLGNGDGFPPIHNGEWYWETLSDMPRRGIWVHLWDAGREIDAGAREERDFHQLYRLCNEIERAIKAEVFVPMIGDACTFCDFSNGPCPVEVPTRAEWEATRLTDQEGWL